MIDEEGGPIKKQGLILDFHDYFNERVRLLEQTVDLKIEAQKAEYTKSESQRETDRDALNVRLEGMNEFRAQLTRQADTFVTCAQLDQKIELALAKQQLAFNNELPKVRTDISRLYAILLTAMVLIGGAFLAHIFSK